MTDRHEGTSLTGAALRDDMVVIFNPVSGSAPHESQLRSELGDSVTLTPTTEDDPGSGQAARAVSAGARTVVVSGGDGTVRAAAESLVGSDVVLGILPFGTGNLLASNLGVPNGFDAKDSLADGRHRRIDVGRVNGETFTVMAGIGFDAEMMADAPSGLKEKLGVAAYVASALRHLRDPLTGTRVIVDGVVWFEGRAAMVLVGNFGTISGGIDLFPEASPDDGQLDVLVLSTSTLRDWARVAWRVVRRRGLSGVAARRTSGREILVESEKPRRWELDGESRDATDRLSVTIEPDSLSVVTGPDHA